MAGQSRLSPEQIEKIRATLHQSLGDGADGIMMSLEEKFKGGARADLDVEGDEDESDGLAPRDPSARVVGQVNVSRIVQEGKVEKMLEALPAVREVPQSVRILVKGILQEGKAFHMVDALKNIRGSDVEVVNALVQGIISKKGINPLIDALRYATESQEAMKALAACISEQGTVSHIIRAIATVHKNPDVELIWSMEVIAKGTVEQILDAINLIDKDSPGTVVLATGVVSNKDSTIEQLVRALNGCKGNGKALTIVAVELAKRADVPALVTLLEKYVTDDSEAGEIVVTKLVQKGRLQQMVDACRHIASNSMSGRMLAAGLAKKAPVDMLIKAYRYLSSSPQAKQIVGLEIVKKKGKLMAMGELGGEVWELVKNQAEIDAFARKAEKRYEWILKNELKEEAGSGIPMRGE